MRKKLFSIVVICLAAWFGWSLFGLRVTESHGPVDAERAESILGITLPPEARNIRAASYSQWIQYGQYLRFEAPVDVCLRFANDVTQGAATRPAGEFEQKQAARTPRAGVFDDFSWFDLHQARDVVIWRGGPSTPEVSVDRERGVVYYRKTD